jgi:FkbM family methyltransferase
MRARTLSSLRRRARQLRSQRAVPAFSARTPIRSESDLACVIAYNKFGGYVVPLRASHRPAAQRILSGDVYEPDTIDLVIAQAADGDVISAGTFFGDFLPAFARGVGTGYAVWAFEPNAESFRCAELTVLLNRLDNVRLQHAALSSVASTLLLQVTDASGRALGGGSRIVSEHPGARRQVLNVPALTIDESVPSDRRVSVIQLDVEGHEAAALEGGMSTIERNLPVLVLETLPMEFYWERLAPLGYEIQDRIHENTVLRPRPQPVQ